MNQERITQRLKALIERYPKLEVCQESILEAYSLLEDCFNANHKLLVAGNGGSAADAEHITGELMKRFRIERKLPEELCEKLKRINAEKGMQLASNLEQGLMTIPLVSHEALTTAYMNDVDASGVFAQQVLGYGRCGDVFWGISTSGNSSNIINAAIIAKALGLRVLSLTGRSGGELAQYSDVIIKVPEDETFIVQELHLPVYHWLCMLLEENFFG